MNRYDWIVVGMCLYGVYLIVQGMLGALGVAIAGSGSHVNLLGIQMETSNRLQTSGFLLAFATSFIGSCLVFGSMKLSMATSKKARAGAYD